MEEFRLTGQSAAIGPITVLQLALMLSTRFICSYSLSPSPISFWAFSLSWLLAWDSKSGSDGRRAMTSMWSCKDPLPVFPFALMAVSRSLNLLLSIAGWLCFISNLENQLVGFYDQANSWCIEFSQWDSDQLNLRSQATQLGTLPAMMLWLVARLLPKLRSTNLFRQSRIVLALQMKVASALCSMTRLLNKLGYCYHRSRQANVFAMPVIWLFICALSRPSILTALLSCCCRAQKAADEFALAYESADGASKLESQGGEMHCTEHSLPVLCPYLWHTHMQLKSCFHCFKNCRAYLPKNCRMNFNDIVEQYNSMLQRTRLPSLPGHPRMAVAFILQVFLKQLRSLMRTIGEAGKSSILTSSSLYSFTSDIMRLLIQRWQFVL